MIKLSAQQCYEHACVAYEKAKSIIADLSVKTREIEKDFNPEIAMRQFDLIAQSVMLSIAVSDGKFNDLEKTFISNITEYADLLVVVNGKMKEEDPEWPEFTWDVIDVLTPENKEKFACVCADTIAEYANEFTLYFSVIDFIDDDRDYHEELLECLFNLITFISAVDEGGFDPDKGATAENLRGLQFLHVLFEENWNKNTEDFVKKLEENNG